MPKEPQSYGSGPDWLSGRTDERVNDPKAKPPAEHQDFYDARGTRESSSPGEGGEPSAQQRAESREPHADTAGDGDPPVRNVTSREGGAKRDSYFRRRDDD